MRCLFALRPVAFASVVLGLAGLGCGNLIIPSNDTSDGGSGSLDATSPAPDDDASSPSGPDDDAEAAADGLAPPNCDAGVFPIALACTGLYTSWTTLTLAPDVVAYGLDPRAQMWTDGASEKEWVWLPPGAKITTTDLNNWVFPAGTKFWQELNLLGSRVETRFLWKMSTSEWFRATYVWSSDQTSAPELTTGMPNALGLPYDIPSVSQCDQCHLGSGDYPLGFEIVGLALGGSTGLTVSTLEQKGLLSNPPQTIPSLPPPDALSPDTTGAMGTAIAYLHSNCGTSCHNRNADANGGQTGLFLKLTVDGTGALPAVEQTDLWTTSYDVPSNYTPAGIDAGGFWRLRPSDAAHSTIPWRASRRNTPAAMPPIDTELVDENAVLALTTWTNELPAGSAPPPPDAGSPPNDLDAGTPTSDGTVTP